MESTDVLIIGSGLAGLRLALQVADNAHVTVVTKRARHQGSSSWAQGGIAAAWRPNDSWEDHVRDTLVAGAGLCRREVVERTAREARQRVQELIDFGVEFDRWSEHPELYDLHKEGGHSRRRILHAKDLTGAEIMRALFERVDAHPNIVVHEHWMVIDLLTRGWLAKRQGELSPLDDEVLGAYVLDTERGTVELCQARVVALCAGGAGQVYLYTTNPAVSSGDGVAMGYRAGAKVANMEFVQFHPTALHSPNGRCFLISEALRGEGGKLLGPDGKPFMHRYDKRLELAPRDIVARAIDSELKRTGADCVFLDMTHMSNEQLLGHFPNIHAHCASIGIDISVKPIPVVPAAHYLCGGVVTDLVGESSVRNLFALGENACTGLHGANRLASNSLLEAVSFSMHAGEEIKRRLPDLRLESNLPEWDVGNAAVPTEEVITTHLWDEVRRFMWSYVGIVRTSRRLQRARRRLDLVSEEIREHYWDYQITPDIVELRNLATVAELVVESALRRRESRGLHYNVDFPATDARFVNDTVLQHRW